MVDQNEITVAQLFDALAKTSNVEEEAKYSRLQSADIVYELHNRGLSYKDIAHHEKMLRRDGEPRYKTGTLSSMKAAVAHLPRHGRPDDPHGVLKYDHLKRLAPLAKHNAALAYNILGEFIANMDTGFSHDNADDPNSIMHPETAFYAKVDMLRVKHGLKEPPKVTEASQFWDVPKAVIINVIEQLEQASGKVSIKNETLHALKEDAGAYIKIILAADENDLRESA